MSEIEIIIKSIENVRMISIYELTGVGNGSGKGCAAVSVFYGRDKHINLCELDKGFDFLVDRVFEIYEEVKDSSSVVMDNRTRQILSSGWIKCDESFLEKYYNAQPAEFPPVAFEAATTGKLLPMVEYLLDSLYKMLGIAYEVTASKTGWRGTGAIFGMKNRSRVVSGVNIIQLTKEEYSIRVNNFAEEHNVLDILVNIRNADIIVEYGCSKLDIHGTGIYMLEPNGYTEFHEAFRDGKKIFRDSRDVFDAEPPVLTDEEKKLIPWDTEDGTGVALPWGWIYFTESKQSTENSCVIDEYHSSFLFRKARLGESRCWTKVKNNDTGFSLKTSSVIMYIMALKKGYQVYFLPNVGNHKNRYRKQLEGRYFVTDSTNNIQDGE